MYRMGIGVAFTVCVCS